jgi:hypothetical protein
MRNVLLMLCAFLLAGFVGAQDADVVVSSTTQPVSGGVGNLPSQTRVTDSQGRTIQNSAPASESGKVKFRFTGKLNRTAQGEWFVTGEISEIENPASGGCKGPILVNTNNQPTTITLDRNGLNPNGHIATTVTGGNATVNVDGNYNDVTVGGTNNTVNFNGNHNSMSAQNGSGGSVSLGGNGNSVSGGGLGGWTIGN